MPGRQRSGCASAFWSGHRSGRRQAGWSGSPNSAGTCLPVAKAGESDPVRAERTVGHHRPAARVPGRRSGCQRRKLGAGFRVPGPPFWSVADAAGTILRTLPGLIGGAPLQAFLPAVPDEVPDRALRCRMAVAGTFVASLELARDSAAELSQTAAWRTIRIAPRPVQEPPSPDPRRVGDAIVQPPPSTSCQARRTVD